MTTNISTTSAASGALASLGNLKAGLSNVAQSIPAAAGDPILKMGRDGVWLYGAENVEVEKGSEWVVNPFSLQHGWICWKKIPDGSKEKPEKLGDVLVSMFDPLPAKHALPDYGHEWVAQTCVVLKCASGDDEGEQVEYKPSSGGGSSAMKDLTQAISRQIDKDPTNPCPVVVLKSSYYENKTYGGRTYVPILEIIDWVSIEGVAAAAPAGDEPAPQEEPAQTGRRRGAPVQAQPDKPETGDETVTETAAAEPAPAGEQRRRRRG